MVGLDHLGRAGVLEPLVLQIRDVDHATYQGLERTEKIGACLQLGIPSPSTPLTSVGGAGHQEAGNDREQATDKCC